MTREEFLTELRLALQGSVDQTVVNENVRYYENYIIEESHKGKTEEEVIAQLGSQRLIAKTIIDTKGQHVYSQETQEDSNKQNTSYHTTHSSIRPWVYLGIGIAILVLIIFIIGSLVAFLLPIVIPVVLIMLVIMLVSGNRR